MPHLVRFYNFSRRLATGFLKEMKTGVSATVSHLESRNAAASGSSDSTGLLINGLEDARVPRGCQRIRGTLAPQPPAPRPGCAAGRASLALLPAWHAQGPTGHETTSLRRSLGGAGFAGRSARARQAGAPRTRARPSGAASPERDPSPGRRAQPAPPPGPRVRPPAGPPSPAPGQLCSA